MLHYLFKDLFLHGEGDGASAAPGNAVPGAEESGVTTPDAGEQTANRRPTKAERRAALEAKLQAERAAAQPQQNQPTAQQEEKLYTEEELNQKIQKAVTGRVKNLKDFESELNATKEELKKSQDLLAQLAAAQYDIQPGADGEIDTAAIEKQLIKTKAEEFAIENGVSEEFAEERIQMDKRLKEQDRQLREFQEAEKKRQQDAEDYAMFRKHQEQAEAFRQEVPGFDLLAEMEKSPLFAHLLRCGVNVKNAFYATHHDELMAVGQQAAATQAQRALAASIQAGQSMPTEGGLGHSPAASPQRVMNFKGRSKAERDAFHKRVQRGEKFYF
jgi:hypothetical protein